MREGEKEAEMKGAEMTEAEKDVETVIEVGAGVEGETWRKIGTVTATEIEIEMATGATIETGTGIEGMTGIVTGTEIEIGTEEGTMGGTEIETGIGIEMTLKATGRDLLVSDDFFTCDSSIMHTLIFIF